VSDSDVIIQNIVFHDEGAFDIAYAEQRDLHEKGIIIRQLMVPPGVIPENIMDDVLDTLRELLDLALERRQDEPSSRPRVRTS
jgi:hypothetical protein